MKSELDRKYLTLFPKGVLEAFHSFSNLFFNTVKINRKKPPALKLEIFLQLGGWAVFDDSF